MDTVPTTNTFYSSMLEDSDIDIGALDHLFNDISENLSSSSQIQGTLSAVQGLCNEDGFQGFDLSAGQTWIYPTNYPVRDYQYNISQACLTKNTLVCLPTGLGKTFIAAVIMYNMYRWYPQGKIVFMAPTKPLVNQQITACQNIVAMNKNEAIEITGKMSIEARRKAWNEKRVFFITPQVLQNDLALGFFPVNLLRLLVVDEAHHTRGKYAYGEVVRMIMEKHKSFRILGLTATPGRTAEQVLEVPVTEVLQALNIGHIEIRGEDSMDVQPYTHSKNVETVVVDLGPRLTETRTRYLDIIDTYVRRLLEMRVISGSTGTLHRGRIVMGYKEYQAASNMGRKHPNHTQIVSDFSASVTLYHGLDLLVSHGYRVFMNFFDDNKNRGWLMRDGRLAVLLQELRECLGPNPLSINNDSLPDGSVPKVSQSIEYGHPKFIHLRKIILQHFQENPTSRIIIFCEFRESVQLVHRLLVECGPPILPLVFVGQRGSGNNFKPLTQKQQMIVMNKFRSGKCNTLISTCIAEEGIDVGEVDLIVCFDTNTKNPIRLVQRMGRTGRQRSGKVILLVTKGREEQTLKECFRNKNSFVSKISNNRHLWESIKSIITPKMIPNGLKPRCVKMFLAPPSPNKNPPTPTKKTPEKKNKRKATNKEKITKPPQKINKGDMRYFLQKNPQPEQLSQCDKDAFDQSKSILKKSTCIDHIDNDMVVSEIMDNSFSLPPNLIELIVEFNLNNITEIITNKEDYCKLCDKLIPFKENRVSYIKRENELDISKDFIEPEIDIINEMSKIKYKSIEKMNYENDINKYLYGSAMMQSFEIQFGYNADDGNMKNANRENRISYYDSVDLFNDSTLEEHSITINEIVLKTETVSRDFTSTLTYFKLKNVEDIFVDDFSIVEGTSKSEISNNKTLTPQGKLRAYETLTALSPIKESPEKMANKSVNNVSPILDCSYNKIKARRKLSQNVISSTPKLNEINIQHDILNLSTKRQEKKLDIWDESLFFEHSITSNKNTSNSFANNNRIEEDIRNEMKSNLKPMSSRITIHNNHQENVNNDIDINLQNLDDIFDESDDIFGKFDNTNSNKNILTHNKFKNNADEKSIDFTPSCLKTSNNSFLNNKVKKGDLIINISKPKSKPNLSKLQKFYRNDSQEANNAIIIENQIDSPFFTKRNDNIKSKNTSIANSHELSNESIELNDENVYMSSSVNDTLPLMTNKLNNSLSILSEPTNLNHFSKRELNNSTFLSTKSPSINSKLPNLSKFRMTAKSPITSHGWLIKPKNDTTCQDSVINLDESVIAPVKSRFKRCWKSDSEEDDEERGAKSTEISKVKVVRSPKKCKRMNMFLDNEAAVSGDEEDDDVEDDDEDVAQFIDDTVNISDETPPDMKAHYLQSIRSPLKQGAFKIPHRPLYTDELQDLLSQVDPLQDTYDIQDSFVVDHEATEYYHELSALEIAELKLEERRKQEKLRLKNKNNIVIEKNNELREKWEEPEVAEDFSPIKTRRKRNDEKFNKDKKLKRIRLLSDSSEEDCL